MPYKMYSAGSHVLPHSHKIFKIMYLASCLCFPLDISWERRFSGIGGMAETAEMAETQEILSGRASTALALALRIIIILYNKIHHNNTVSMCCSEHQCFSMARPFHADAYRLEIIRTVLPAMLTIKANHTLKSLY